jgi:hypothetical protein
MVPPVARLDTPDEDCPLDLVTDHARRLESAEPVLLTLSRSWSGQCAALAARACAV